MKTIKQIILAGVLLFAFSQAQAQVTFKPGLRAGANFSHFTDGDYNADSGIYYSGNGYVTNQHLEFSSKTDFYVGFYGALHLTKYYTLQPEFTYSRQGSKFESSAVDANTGVAVAVNKGQIDVSYISVAVINKFTFTDKFNMHIGPTFDIIVDKNNGFNNSLTNSTFYNNNYYDTDSDVDLAFVFGLGYNFTKNLGLELRVKKGIVPVLDSFDDNHTNVVFSGGLTYTFDIK